MKVLNFFKYLFVGSKQKVGTARVAETSIESIEFPPTYRDVNWHHSIPAKVTNSLSGSQFGQSIINLIGEQRDNIIYQQCLNGNLPDWMRNFKAITVEEKGNTLIYFVSPDVLCIGDNDDFLRVSLNAYTARKVVDAFGCMLPTKKISDQIWKASNLRMMPTGMGNLFNMVNTNTLIRHNAVIEKQRADRNFNIISGHKKDIVYAKYLLSDKTRISIYGWHYPDGHALQGPNPNSSAHNTLYQDYSHSIRLVSRKAILNGQPVDLLNLLNDKQYTYLISEEGAYDASRIYCR